MEAEPTVRPGAHPHPSERVGAASAGLTRHWVWQQRRSGAGVGTNRSSSAGEAAARSRNGAAAVEALDLRDWARSAVSAMAEEVSTCKAPAARPL